MVASCVPYIGLVWFLFLFFVTRSNLSSFATGSSLWAELSCIVFLVFLGWIWFCPFLPLGRSSSSGSGRWFSSFLLLLLGRRSFLSFGSLLWGSSPSLSSWSFPPSRMGWLSFFSFFVVVFRLSGFVRSLLFLSQCLFTQFTVR